MIGITSRKWIRVINSSPESVVVSTRVGVNGLTETTSVMPPGHGMLVPYQADLEILFEGETDK